MIFKINNDISDLVGWYKGIPVLKIDRRELKRRFWTLLTIRDLFGVQFI